VAFSSGRVYYRGLSHRLPFRAAAEGQGHSAAGRRQHGRPQRLFRTRPQNRHSHFHHRRRQGQPGGAVVPAVSCAAIHHFNDRRGRGGRA